MLGRRQSPTRGDPGMYRDRFGSSSTCCDIPVTLSMIEVKAHESGGCSNGRQLAVARPWCKGVEISHEDITRATSHTMFGGRWHTQGPGRS